VSSPKFPECVGCRFFIKTKRPNPICGECGIGEFYEPKTRSRAPTDDELMSLFGRMHDED
jgi:hypothetical protein